MTLGTPSNSAAPHPLRWLWLAGALLSVVVFGAAGSMLGPVLPVLVRDLALPLPELYWILGAWMLGFAVLIVPGAMLGDLLGHARIHLLGALGFTAASVLGAVADSESGLLAARLGQGLGAALATPQVVGYARAHLPRVERAIACALFGLAFVAGPALGPMLSTRLVDDFGWRSVFWVLVPVAAVATLTAVPLVFQRLAIRFDLMAFLVAVLAVPATFGIVFPLAVRDVADWPAWYFVPLVLGCLLLAACFAIEIARRGVRAGLGAPLVALLVFAGAAYYSTLVLYVQVTGQPVLTIVIAAAAMPVTAGAFVGAIAAVLLGLWTDSRIAVAAGAAILTVGAVVELLLLESAPDSVGLAALAVAAAGNGLGLGLVVATLSRGDGATLSRGDDAGGRQPIGSAPGVLFVALALGTPAGAVLSRIIQQTSNVAAVGGRADLLNAIRDATGSVLILSIVLLAVAVVVAVLLAPRGRAGR
jgi:MFS family permease